MAVHVHTPVEGFTGVVAGVAFDQGTAQVEALTPSQRAYFRAQGYGIDAPASPPVAPVPADPRALGRDGDGIEHLGTPLRDAAVNPRPDDFLPPTNAGRENPHGPLVIAPEIHGSQGTRPVAAGPVAPAERQEAAETAHAADHTHGTDDAPEVAEVARPKVRDDIDTWRRYRAAQRHQVEGLTKQELIDLPDTPVTDAEEA